MADPLAPGVRIGSAPPLAGRILFAEDTPDTRLLVTRLLRQAGLEVHAVENGAQMLALALVGMRAGEPFDLILTDLEMPVLDGYRATARIRDAGYEGPIIALTAYAREEERVAAVAVGCSAFITKPVDRSELIELLRVHLEKSGRR